MRLRSLLNVGCAAVVACLLVLASAASAQEVDVKPLAVTVKRAYPELRVRRPITLTHAGDGSGRKFVVSEQGVIHILPQDESGDEAAVFLDIEAKVDYEDKENEEGLLGLAFHPKFKENGEFFVYYTLKNPPHTSALSRFKVSKADPNKADPASEEEILRIPQPYWNHNGGGLMFGPEGYLYVALGDGGSGNDPHGHGQNLSTLLGSILRIDVDHKDPGLAYAIPKDNPFVGQKEARPEIYAYGVRNIWGMTYDKESKLFFAADVGQNLWEEINIVVKGGNYGWNLREGLHKFGDKGSDPRPNLIEPIWEYHHDIGKSITGGHVYRGKAAPSLQGHYVYADYVTGKIWALKYDAASKKVVANRPIPSPVNYALPVMGIGQDEAGELYLCDSFGMLWKFTDTNP